MSTSEVNVTVAEDEFPIGWQGWYTVGVIVVAFVVMLRDLVPPDFVFLFSLVAVISAQVITVQEGLEGFASSAVLSVAVLYAVAAGISGTGALDYLMNKVLGSPTRLSEAQLRLMLPVAFISAFMNNTPVVAVMIPIISQWSRRTGIPASHLFIPLSFSSILGGTCTLIGTSTNLVLQGRAEETPAFNNITIGIFDVSMVGLPTLFMGFTYIFLFSKLLLPTPQTMSKRSEAQMGGKSSSLRNFEHEREVAAQHGSDLNSSVDKPTSDQPPAELSSGRSLFGEERHAATTGGIDDDMPQSTITPTLSTTSSSTSFGISSSISGGGGVLGLLRQAGHVVSAASPKGISTSTATEKGGHKCPHKPPTVVTQYGQVRDAYTAGCVVDPHSPVVGRTVESAGLRGLDGLFLTSVQRGNHLLGPQAVGPAFVLSGGDILFFAGLLNHFADFCNRFGFTQIMDVSHNEDGHGRVGTIDTNVDYMDYMYQRHGRSAATTTGVSSQHGNNDEVVDRASHLSGSNRSPGGGPSVLFRRRKHQRISNSSGDTQVSSAPERVAPIAAAVTRNAKDARATATASPTFIPFDASPPTNRKTFPTPGGIEMPDLPPPAFLSGNVIKLRIKNRGALIGATPKEVNFRRRYHAAILSISRDGERMGVTSGAGRVVLQAGDVLTLMKGNRFSWENFETCRDLESISAGVDSGVRKTSLSFPNKNDAGSVDVTRRSSRSSSGESERLETDTVNADAPFTIQQQAGDVELLGSVRHTMSEANGKEFATHRDSTRDSKKKKQKQKQEQKELHQSQTEATISTSSSSRPHIKHTQSMNIPSRRSSTTATTSTRASSNSNASASSVGGVDAVSESEMKQIQREFLFSMRVLDSSKLIGARSLVGLSVEASGLRGLPGLFLVAIDHEDGTYDHAVGSDAVLRKNDVLWFAGDRAAVSTLRRIPGIAAPDDHQLHKLKVNLLERRLVESVLSLKSDMIGDTIKKARFRTRFDAAVIAVHRRGERVISKIGDIVLQPGDVLLLDTGPNFLAKFREDQNFLLMSEIENSTPPRFDKFYIALLAILMMMLGYLFTNEYMSLFEWSVFATFVMLVSGCLTVDKARKAVNWEVIVTIACAFGLSTALEKTNVAGAVGAGLVDFAESSGTGEAGVLSAIYMATFLLSVVVANNAAALLMYPIALQASTTLDIPLDRMLYTLMLAASSSFASPFGYQTNLMVFGPGGYTFRDFATFGFPMQFWQMIFSITFLLFNDVWYICLLVSFLFFLSVYFGMKYLDGRSTESNGSVSDDGGFRDVVAGSAVRDVENYEANVNGKGMGVSLRSVNEDKQMLLEEQASTGSSNSDAVVVNINEAQNGSNDYVITEQNASEHVAQVSKLENEEQECADLPPLTTAVERNVHV